MKINFSREYLQAFLPIIIYVVLVVVLVMRNIINLNLERDRALFQGLTAIGIALFVFLQFELDYRNRKRNVLYEKQINALMEYHSIVSGIILFLVPNPFIVFQSPEEAFVDLERAIKRYEDFINLEKWLFVRSILERLGMSKDTLTRNFLILQKLIIFLKKEGEKLSKLTENSLEERIEIYDPSLLDPEERKFFDKAFLEISQKSVPIFSFSEDGSKLLEKMRAKMSLREAEHEMWKFTLKMKNVIQQELGML